MVKKNYLVKISIPLEALAYRIVDKNFSAINQINSNLVAFKLKIIDRENKVELRKLSEAVESLEHGGSFDLIDI